MNRPLILIADDDIDILESYEFLLKDEYENWKVAEYDFEGEISKEDLDNYVNKTVFKNLHFIYRYRIIEVIK